ncbi:MAG: bacteriohemerythrin [Candidatus Micrarchaeota archaeon]|nr:bacteriohemerythrin [Candidatus Micrarchaeota archaeon]
MAIFEWSNELSVGVPSLDEQHKKLVKLINDLNEAMKNGKAKEVLGKILKELLDYTKYHFSTEEKYMAQVNYVASETHKLEHQQLIKKALALENDFKNGKATITIDVINFLKEWVSKHIMGTDKKYSSAFIEKGIK